MNSDSPGHKVFINKDAIVSSVDFQLRILRIFLGATFEDMKRERQAINQNLYPRLKHFCKDRDVDLVFVDLRFGIVEGTANDDMTLLRCFEAVVKCPYFIHIMGSRYGWIPDHRSAAQWHPSLEQSFPLLREAGHGRSVLDYQVYLAALSSKPSAGRTFFFSRNQGSALMKAESPEEKALLIPRTASEESSLQKLRAEILTVGHILDYESASALTEVMWAELTKYISIDFPAIQPTEVANQAHETFLSSWSHLAVREHQIKQFRSQLLQESIPCIVVGEAGIGKSSLLASLCEDVRQRSNARVFLFSHFVGCESSSYAVNNIISRLWQQLCMKGIVKSVALSETDLQERGLSWILYQLQNRQNHHFYIIIDGLDRLQKSASSKRPESLEWLPVEAPPNVTIVLSCVSNHIIIHNALRRKIRRHNMQRMTEPEIHRFLAAYMEDNDMILGVHHAALIKFKQKITGLPLCLKLILDDVKQAEPSNFDQRLDTLLSADSTAEVYRTIILKWESMHGNKLAQISLCALCNCKFGLTESELDAYMIHRIGSRLHMEEWKSFFYRLQDLLDTQQSRFKLIHKEVAKVIAQQYMSNQSTKLAEVRHIALWLYARVAPDLHAADYRMVEVCDLLLQSNCLRELLRYLQQEHVIESILQGSYRSEFFRWWSQLRQLNKSDKDHYMQLLKSSTNVADLLVSYFKESGQVDFVVEVYDDRKTELRNFAAICRQKEAVADVHLQKGRFTEAIEMLRGSIELRKASEGETLALVHTYKLLVSTYHHATMHREAIHHGLLAIAILEKLGYSSHPLMAQIQHRIGDSEQELGMLVKAEERLVEALDIFSTEYGPNHPQMPAPLVSMANLCFRQGRTDQAEHGLRCAQRALEIQRLYFPADSINIASLMFCIAEGLNVLKRYDEARASAEKGLDLLIQSKIEESHIHAGAHTILGSVAARQNRYPDAKKHFEECLRIRKRFYGNDSLPVAMALHNVASVQEMSSSDVAGAVELYKEAHTIKQRMLGRQHPSAVSTEKQLQRLEAQIRQQAKEKAFDDN